MTARSRASAGFTLLEVVIALAIVAALLTIAFGGLRIALAAWTQGEERADTDQHTRTLVTALVRSISALHAYKMAASSTNPTPVIQLDGKSDQISFVTRDAPLPLDPIFAFTAVRLSVESGDEPGLVIRELALPNQDPFTEAAPVLRDPAVKALEFRYLTTEGEWQDNWDGALENALPQAIRVTFTATFGKRPPVSITNIITLMAVHPRS